LANTGFQTVYNYIGLEPKHTAWSYALVIWNLGKWNSVKRNETRRIGGWSDFCILLSRVGLSALAGLSCYNLPKSQITACSRFRTVLHILWLKLQNLLLSHLSSHLCNGSRSTNALNINSFHLPTKFS